MIFFHFLKKSGKTSLRWWQFSGMWNMNLSSPFVEMRWDNMWENICKVVKQYVMFGEWKLVLRDYGIGKGSEVKVPHSYLTLWPHGLYSPWSSPVQNTRVGSLSHLQGNFPTKGSNPGLLHCRWNLYQLSHKESPRILEWVAYSFYQGIFLTQESNQDLLHCRQVLYQLSYQESF